MMKTANFELLLPLQPKTRPRFSGHAYNQSKYASWKKQARAILGEWWTVPPLKKGQILCLHVLFRGPGTSDLDNLTGALLDAGNGIVWSDDRVTVISRIDAQWQQASRLNQSIKLSVIFNE